MTLSRIDMGMKLLALLFEIAWHYFFAEAHNRPDKHTISITTTMYYSFIGYSISYSA